MPQIQGDSLVSALVVAGAEVVVGGVEELGVVLVAVGAGVVEAPFGDAGSDVGATGCWA